MSVRQVKNRVGVWEIRSKPGSGTQHRLIEDHTGVFWPRSKTAPSVRQRAKREGRPPAVALKKRKPAKRLSASAEAYAKGEERYAAELKRRPKAPAPLSVKQARTSKLLRHSHSARERDEMVRKGVSMFDGTHPIRTADELRRAIRLACEPGAARDSLRWHCQKRARSMDLTNLIPSNWRGDGTLIPRAPARRAFDVKPKYSPEAIQRFGEEEPPRAFKKANGKYGWPILDGEDVSNAIDDHSAMNPSPPGVRAWIIKRARELRVEHRLPKGWGVVTPKPGPNAS